MKTNRERFLQKHKLPQDTSLSLAEIAELSGFPLSALRLVYNRGIGAHSTNLESVRLKPGSGYGRAYQKGVQAPASAKLSPEQWAYGRLFAFVMKSPKVFYGADKDIKEMYGLK